MRNILIIGCGLLGTSLVRRISKKKIAKAVERNKLKRQLKAIYAEDFSWNLNKHLAIVYIANYVCELTTIKEAMQKIKNTYEKS